MDEKYRGAMSYASMQALSNAVAAAKDRLDRDDPDEDRTDEYWVLDEPEVNAALDALDMSDATWAAYEVLRKGFVVDIAREMNEMSPAFDTPDRFVKMLCLYAVVYIREKMA